MNRHTATRGATLVVVVLFTSLLLAVLLAASSQLTLSSRRTVSDQRAALQAQYVAESGVALAQSRLRDVQTLMSVSSLSMGTGLTASKLKGYAEKFCGNTSWTTVSQASGTKRYTCTASTTGLSDQFEVFAQFVLPAKYTEVLPASERPTNVNDLDSRRQWWKAQLGESRKLEVNGATVNYRLKPSRVERINNESYTFFIQVEGLNVGGSSSGATRVLKADRTNLTGWWVQIALPSYLDNVLFTNHHTQDPNNANVTSWNPTVNFTDQIFDGPVHTNEKFLFASGSTAQFKGGISSAGCTNLKQTVLNDDQSCTRQAGFYYGGNGTSNLRAPDNATASDADKNVNLWQKLTAAAPGVGIANVKDGSGNDTAVKDATFTAAYRPMPINANSQRDAAQGKVPSDKQDDPEEKARYESGKGLYFTDDVAGIVLSTGNAAGVAPTSYNTVTKKWSPEPLYQYVRVAKKTIKQEIGQETRCTAASNGKCTQTETIKVYKDVLSDFEEYRVDGSGKMEKKANGTWTTHLTKFNGVIFGEKNIGVLKGPDRSVNATIDGKVQTLSPPAIAGFSQLTVAAEKNINIASDLRLTDEPCNPADTACKNGKPTQPLNVLGVYTQSGDVVINKEAPNNLHLHAMLMSSKGEVRVDGHQFGADRGNVNLIGGVVENWYGAFGSTSSINPDSGYGRNFSHDRRFEDPGFTPPFFAQSPVWIPADPGKTSSLSQLIYTQTNKTELKVVP
ncbi:PilX N-terminal domain-containing pilus assembly protein [Deinococcus sp. YIM 134068]|uniref:PilX N-terminal domain-containing pilus assembly protein n=1 Tax=Deinococcus lichenicola TaxID=3118910 RepID=UPI002F92F56E